MLLSSLAEGQLESSHFLYRPLKEFSAPQKCRDWLLLQECCADLQLMLVASQGDRYGSRHLPHLHP